MHNRLLPRYHANRESTDDARVGWNHRLVVVYIAILIAFVAIGVRLAWIQTQLADEYITAFDVTRVEFEPIPGRDGRVLTDTTVLAADVLRYDVEAHYRWLEYPADAGWLKQKTRPALSRSERRDADKVSAAERAFLSERDVMWHRLIDIAQLDRQGVSKRRAAIQDRVERIAKSVNDRREAKRKQPEPEIEADGLTGLLEQVKTQLTAAPSRGGLAPIVVQEELDYHPIAENVPLAVAAEIRAHPELYPGLRVRDATARTYPQGSLAAHVVGSRARNPESSDTHRVGRSGIERSYDGRLKGIDGRRKLTLNRRGEIVRSEVVREPMSGRDVVLTIDTGLQRSAESLLDAALANQDASAEQPPPKGGCVIVMDAFSGDVLAMANAPRFDLNMLVHPQPDEWKATMDDPRHPLFPRASQMTVPPGSVFKVLTAAAMLEASDIHPDHSSHCQGYLDRPDRHRCYIFRHHGVGHGDVNLRGALAQSCNVYFFKAARRMGVGPLVQWSERFGFGQRTGIDLPFERSGQVPQPARGRNGQRSRWYSGDTLGLAIGQSRLTVTPLQVVRMMAAVANGGYLVTPRVADESGVSARQVQSWTPRPRRRIHELTEETLAEIRHGLFSAVQDPGGTGYKSVRLESVTIAGKTGTAETGGGRPDHAWFAGYVPAGRPRFAVLVMLEHGGSGGAVAGPVARQLVQAMVTQGLVESGNVAATDVNRRP